MRHRLPRELREVWNRYGLASVFGTGRRGGVKGHTGLNIRSKFAMC